MKVIWSAEAKKKRLQIEHYLKLNWSKKSILKFRNRLKHFELLVIKFPKIYQSSTHHKKLRKAVISKHQSVIYQIKHNTIEVVTIIDNREKPMY